MGDKGYYIYNDTEPKRAFSVRIEFNPNVMYVRHYGNYLELSFICERTEGLNRFQAEKELAICEKKLAYWKKMAGWSMRECGPMIQKVKRQWERLEIPDRWS